MARTNTEEKAPADRFYELGKLVLGDHAALRPDRADVVELGKYCAGEVDAEPAWLPTLPSIVWTAVGFQRNEAAVKRAREAAKAQSGGEAPTT